MLSETHLKNEWNVRDFFVSQDFLLFLTFLEVIVTLWLENRPAYLKKKVHRFDSNFFSFLFYLRLVQTCMIRGA